MRRITIVSYSPSGISRKIAETLAGYFSAEYCVIDLTDPAVRQTNCFFSSEDLLIFAAPSYLGRLPVVEGGIFDRIYANDTPGIFLAIFGNRSYEDMLLEMAQIAEDRGVIGIGALALAISGQAQADEIRRGELKKAWRLEVFANNMSQILSGIEEDPAYYERHSLTVNGNFPYKAHERTDASQEPFFSQVRTPRRAKSAEYFYMKPDRRAYR